jgi:alpha-beta hydrolase superfamily lysophospholipase
MRRLLSGMTAAFWLIALTACAPPPSHGLGSEPGFAGPWRHWQPEGARHAGMTDDKESGDDEESEIEAEAAGPKAVILALHGFNDYSNAFQAFAAFCNERNIAVHAYDQRSFGATPNRGIWPGVEPLVADLHDAVAGLRKIYGDRPLFVLGESMGGAVTILAATNEKPLEVDGLILSAPAVWGGSHMNAFYRLTLWLTSTIAPGWTLSPSGLEIWPSDNIEMLRAYSADPLVIKRTRTDAIAGLVDLMDQALAAAPELDREVLLLAGDKDEIVPTGAIDDFESRLDPKSLTSVRYPEGFHMLLRDLQRANVYADIDAWIDRNIAVRQASRRPTSIYRDATHAKKTEIDDLENNGA